MRIYKRKNSWYLDYTYKGKRIRKSVGRSKKVAELTLKDIEVKIAKEEHLGIHDKKRILFKDFAKEYLKFSKANKAIKSYTRDITSIRNLLPNFGDDYLTNITAEKIEKYKIERLEKVTPASVNRELSCIKHLLNKGIEWGYLIINPAKQVKKLKEPPGRVRYLEIEEIRKLLKECAPYLRPIVVTALNTGIRRSELFNLKWTDIDFKEKLITVRNSKNNESRTIPMNYLVHEELKEFSRSNGEYIFGKDGNPRKDLRGSFKTALKRAGIKDFRFHDLRHTFASHLMMNGSGLKTVQQLMGHKTIQMTLRYGHLSKAHLQDAVTSLGDRFSMAQIWHNTEKEKSEIAISA